MIRNSRVGNNSDKLLLHALMVVVVRIWSYTSE